MNNLARPLKTSKRITTMGIAAILLGWTALAIIATTTAFIALRASGLQSWLNILSYMLSYYYTWVVFALLIYVLVQRQIGQSLWIWPIYGLLLLCFSVILSFTTHFEDWQDWLYGSRAPGFHLLNISIFFIVLIGVLALKRYQTALAAERAAHADRLRAIQLENQLTASQLAALRMQINPHFLFNALNSIASLIETRSNDDAYRATEVLGQLLRGILDRSATQWTSVADEVSLIQQYVDMEQIRFGHQLKYNCGVDKDCLDELIPVAVLQPLVENAIKHGVRPSPVPVTISLKIFRQKKSVCLRVHDTGCSAKLEQDQQRQCGLGLENIRQHLQLLYGDAYRLTIGTASQQQGTEVLLTLPLTTTIDH